MEKTTFLVRDASEYNTVYFAIELEDKEYWEKVKKYVQDMREKNENYRYLSDSIIIEEYFHKNKIGYNIIYFEDELFL